MHTLRWENNNKRTANHDIIIGISHKLPHLLSLLLNIPALIRDPMSILRANQRREFYALCFLFEVYGTEKTMSMSSSCAFVKINVEECTCFGGRFLQAALSQKPFSGHATVFFPNKNNDRCQSIFL